MTILNAKSARLASFLASKGVTDGLDSEQSLSEALLKWFDLSQSQIAALLGISPQAISKALKDEEAEFFEKDRRIQRLYGAMQFIGGDRYALSVLRIKELSSHFDLGPLDDIASNLVRASDLYAGTDELWVISDNPGKIIDWTALKKTLFAERRDDATFKNKSEKEKVVIFFMSTLEGAENWAEALEREAMKPAIVKTRVEIDRGMRFGANVFVIVTNLTAFTGDYVITNPGSRCMGMLSSAKPTGMYNWSGDAYFLVNPSGLKGFVQAAHRNELGQGSLKKHFFPQGERLGADKFDFPLKFLDGLIAIVGLEPVGGVLRNSSQYPQITIDSNSRRTKYTPAFLLTYKRTPGDSFNEGRPKRVVEAELQEQQPEVKATPW
jgi:transcriptional regulator with XRE-family HTH domain